MSENTHVGSAHKSRWSPGQPLQHHVEFKHIVPLKILQCRFPATFIEPVSPEEYGVITPICVPRGEAVRLGVSGT